MLGDVLLITEKHLKAGEIIIEKIMASRKPKMIIGISGESGSGKSELAHVIAKGLRKHGIFAKPLHIDNYYRILPLKRTDWRKEQGIEKLISTNSSYNGLNQDCHVNLLLTFPTFSSQNKELTVFKKI